MSRGAKDDWRAVYDWAGLIVRRLVRAEYDPATTSLLDVGAGQGKYRRLLPEFTSFDAVEVWEPYVVDNRLRELYRDVHVVDVMKLVDCEYDDWWSGYDVVVMGDVLEHLSYADGYQLLDHVSDLCDDVVVVVPYTYPQGPEDGNEHQRHLQDDLTPELMASEYPLLRLVAVESRDNRPFKGLYRWRYQA